MTDRNVMLAFPHAGTVRAEFMMAVVRLAAGDSPVGEIADRESGPGIGIARNDLAVRFLSSSMDWLWFCDTDTVISDATLPALLDAADEQDRPVLGAVCCILHDHRVRTATYATTRDVDGTFAFTHLGELPADTLLRVDATGCGCLLIHRSVFKRLSEANAEWDGLWFAEMIVDTHQLGEDLSFCMRCAMAEIPVFVHSGIEVGHMKAVMLGQVTA